MIPTIVDRRYRISGLVLIHFIVACIRCSIWRIFAKKKCFRETL